MYYYSLQIKKWNKKISSQADIYLITRLGIAMQRHTTMGVPPPSTPALGTTDAQQPQTRTGLAADTLWTTSAVF
jgi:hypothetical protein